MFARVTQAMLCSMFLISAARAEKIAVVEMPWTRVPAAELEKFEAKLGEIRVNNFALEKSPRTVAAGSAAVHDFSASIANRSKMDAHVLVQVVGVQQDASPTLSAEGSVDIEARHTETLRSTTAYPEQATMDTIAYYVRVLATPPD